MSGQARRWERAGALVVLAVLASSTAGARPAAGSYDAQFCVSMSAQAPSCGAVQVELATNGAALVRAADIVYVLKLRPRQLDLVLMQGTMQLDEFTVPYRWDGNALQFADDEKNARYELRFGKRRP